VDISGEQAAGRLDAPRGRTLLELTRMRWAFFGAELVVLALAKLGLKADYALWPILVLLGLGLASNVGLSVRARGHTAFSQAFVAAVLVFDTALLTGVLLVSGGAMNPFTVFYLVEVVVAAFVLDTKGLVALVLFTSAGFGSLFWLTPEAEMHRMHRGGGFSAHLQGMWVSYALAALFVGFIVARLARDLALRTRELRELEIVAARAEKLASLSTLAAGAAHELGTPLGTIAVVARELEHAAERGTIRVEDVLHDARLLRGQAERCRTILSRMAAKAGDPAGEAPRWVAPSEIARDLMVVLSDLPRERLALDVSGEARVRVPVETLVEVLSNLVHNAADALDALPSEEREQPIEVVLTSAPGKLRCEVRDRGLGMDEGILARLGEPFFTTKPVGRGLGLGVFLVRSFVERGGGTLDVRSRPAEGTTVILDLPSPPFEGSDSKSASAAKKPLEVS
jgi:two-component system sensor histidine kinase RegB